ncbi:hypothetical protein Tco_0951061 [Tanacetum coccineum]|uniref:Uncharacterized protein n=1 Tax=Tanacetum coccineum TaxID=301880 RepID=A0ABQ5DVT9_9ASTR
MTPIKEISTNRESKEEDESEVVDEAVRSAGLTAAIYFSVHADNEDEAPISGVSLPPPCATLRDAGTIGHWRFGTSVLTTWPPFFSSFSTFVLIHGCRPKVNYEVRSTKRSHFVLQEHCFPRIANIGVLLLHQVSCTYFVAFEEVLLDVTALVACSQPSCASIGTLEIEHKLFVIDSLYAKGCWKIGTSWEDVVLIEESKSESKVTVVTVLLRKGLDITWVTHQFEVVPSSQSVANVAILLSNDTRSAVTNDVSSRFKLQVQLKGS